MSSYAQYYSGNRGGGGVSNQQSFLSNNAYRPQNPAQRFDNGGLSSGNMLAPPVAPTPPPSRVYQLPQGTPQAMQQAAQRIGIQQQRMGAPPSPKQYNPGLYQDPKYQMWLRKQPWAQRNTRGQGDLYSDYLASLQQHQYVPYGNDAF